MWDFVMDKNGDGAGFLRELGFPLPISIPSTSPQSSSLSPEAGTIGQVAAVPIASQTKYIKKNVKPGNSLRILTTDSNYTHVRSRDIQALFYYY
jgi:hypothetical protein